MHAVAAARVGFGKLQAAAASWQSSNLANFKCGFNLWPLGGGACAAVALAAGGDGGVGNCCCVASAKTIQIIFRFSSPSHSLSAFDTDSHSCPSNGQRVHGK